jgi:hypothetical protein
VWANTPSSSERVTRQFVPDISPKKDLGIDGAEDDHHADEEITLVFALANGHSARGQGD